MWLAVEVEMICKKNAVPLQVGTPRVFGAEEIEWTIEKFKEYGPRRKRAATPFIRRKAAARGP